MFLNRRLLGNSGCRFHPSLRSVYAPIIPFVGNILIRVVRSSHFETHPQPVRWPPRHFRRSFVPALRSDFIITVYNNDNITEIRLMAIDTLSMGGHAIMNMLLMVIAHIAMPFWR